MEGHNVSLSLALFLLLLSRLAPLNGNPVHVRLLFLQLETWRVPDRMERAEQGTGTDRRGTSALHFSALLSTLKSDLPLVCAGQPAPCFRVPILRRTRFHFSRSRSEKGERKRKGSVYF